MTFVGLAIKLALMNGTRVFPSVRFDAPGFLSVPLAIGIVPANDLISFEGAWNPFGSEAAAGAGEQYNKRDKEEEVLQRVTSRFGEALYQPLPLRRDGERTAPGG